MKKLAIRQKLLNYISIANYKKIHAIFILFEDEIKKSEIILQNTEREIIANDLNRISWGNYMTQEEMQKITEGIDFQNQKSNCLNYIRQSIFC